MMTVMTVVLVSLYVMVAGFAGRVTTLRLTAKCPQRTHGYCGHVPGGVAAGAFWLPALPAFIGLVAANRVSDPMREENKRNKEIEEASHKLRVARIDAQAIEVMERAHHLNK